MTTKELASTLKISTRALRRILRSFKRYDDKKYTRYRLTKADVAQVSKRLEPVAA